MHPSQAMFSGEVPKKEAKLSLSFWSLFLSAARTEHTLQYMPHGDKYSFFTPIFSPPLSSNPKKIIIAILLEFAYTAFGDFNSHLIIITAKAKKRQMRDLRSVGRTPIPIAIRLELNPVDSGDITRNFPFFC